MVYDNTSHYLKNTFRYINLREMLMQICKFLVTLIYKQEASTRSCKLILRAIISYLPNKWTNLLTGLSFIVKICHWNIIGRKQPKWCCWSGIRRRNMSHFKHYPRQWRTECTVIANIIPPLLWRAWSQIIHLHVPVRVQPDSALGCNILLFFYITVWYNDMQDITLNHLHVMKRNFKSIETTL